MPVESATYISDLVPANPLSGDTVDQGDNHLRLTKQVLQNQFPNLGAAAVTPTAAEVNVLTGSGVSNADLIKLAAVTSSAAEINILDGATVTATQLNYLSGTTAADQVVIPSGVIVMIQSDEATPTGWVLCDGLNGTPNMNNKFPRGTTGTSTATGGADTDVLSFNTGSHALTVSQIPGHTHTFSATTSSNGAHSHTYKGSNVTSGLSRAVINSSAATYTASTDSAGAHTHTVSGTTSSAGSGSGHTHTVSTTVDTVPAYQYLRFIMKT